MTTTTGLQFESSASLQHPVVEETAHESRVPWVEQVTLRKWPLIVASLMVIVGLAFMLAWIPLRYHQSSWYTGDDLWGIFRSAHYVGWGFLGGVYSPGSGVVTFPGIAVALAPVAILSGMLHLSESYPPIFLSHPSAALILQPIELLLSSTVVFATDALARRLRVLERRRIVLCIVVGIIAWPIAAVWGHAEDALAVTFAVYAMVAMLDQKWARCGWLLGFGVVTQPLVALMIPMVIGAAPGGRRIALAVRTAALSAVLVGVAFAGNAGDTFRALVKQPTPPAINHATPWVAVAPKLTSSVGMTSHEVHRVTRHGHSVFAEGTSTIHTSVMVAGGPGRLIDVVLALLCGLYVWRRPQSSTRLLWLMAAILASRLFFEAVMTPYYIAPPLFLGLVLAARQGGKRLWAAGVLAIAITVFAYGHRSPWAWWLPILAALAVILALGYPSRSTSESESPLLEPAPAPALTS
jgi:hypothetical protein